MKTTLIQIMEAKCQFEHLSLKYFKLPYIYFSKIVIEREIKEKNRRKKTKNGKKFCKGKN